MSLMMRCIETYDAMEHLAGKCVNEDRKETLAPIGHILACLLYTSPSPRDS